MPSSAPTRSSLPTSFLLQPRSGKRNEAPRLRPSDNSWTSGSLSGDLQRRRDTGRAGRHGRRQICRRRRGHDHRRLHPRRRRPTAVHASRLTARTDAMAASSGPPLAIIAGAGSVPLHVAAAALSSGRKVVILGIEGEADGRIADYPHAWFNWGQLGRLEKLLAEHGTRDVVLIGAIRSRPDFKTFKLDFGTVRVLPEILSVMANGDNTLLTGVIKMFEARGYSIVGAHEIAADLVARPGLVAGRKPRSSDLDDVRIAICAAQAIG